MGDYNEQLQRALSETPGISADSGRLDVPVPDVRQEGSATVYENFHATVNEMDRDPSLVMKFLQNELGTSAHIDERGRARLTGEFTSARIEGAIESFVNAYVLCPECGLPDTRLVEEGDTQMVKCDACGALSPTG